MVGLVIRAGNGSAGPPHRLALGIDPVRPFRIRVMPQGAIPAADADRQAAQRNFGRPDIVGSAEGMRQGDQQQDHAGRRDGDAAPRTPHDPGDDGADEGAEASDAMGFMVPPCSQFGNIQFGMCRGWRRFFGSQCLRRT